MNGDVKKGRGQRRVSLCESQRISGKGEGKGRKRCCVENGWLFRFRIKQNADSFTHPFAFPFPFSFNRIDNIITPALPLYILSPTPPNK